MKMNSNYFTQMNPVSYTIFWLITNAYGSRVEFQTIPVVIERLPTHVIPITYELTIEPEISGKTFKGEVKIEVEVKEKSKNITLHANELEIGNGTVNVSTLDGTTVNVSQINLQPDSQFLVIKFKKWLKAGTRYMINFTSFSGNLSESEKIGFYLEKYTDGAGEVHEFVTTQFQRIGARKAFPCFDEPHLKAKFTIHLIRPIGYTSVSNEELISSTEYEKEKYIDTYPETKMMSSYLVAFVISKYVPTKTQQRQRVFADEEAIKNGEGDYALEWGVKVLSKLEVLTGVWYEFSKLDQIAIPDAYQSFSSMGLVTYKKSELVYPLKEQTTAGRVRTFSNIAHEYAHQWFGNLVTCAWWKYTWLNEGFAEYFAYVTPTKLNLNMEGLFLLDSVQEALAKDGEHDVLAMNSEYASSLVNSQKSAAVIRMLYHVVTQKVFEAALKSYLVKHAYGSVTPADLYSSFQRVLEDKQWTHLTGEIMLMRIMGSWDSNPGYPLLTVNRHYDTGEINLVQTRFFSDPSEQDDQSIWHIPINLVAEVNLNSTSFADTSATDWFSDKTGKLTELVTDGWIILNKQQSGYYRIMYDQENWKLLTEQLIKKDHTKIHIYNKAQLIDDSFTFASIGLLDYTIALNLTKFLKTENTYVPIATFLKHAKMLDDRLTNEIARENFKTYMNHILNGVAFQELGMVEKGNETIEAQYLRTSLMFWLCKVGNENCKTYTANMFNASLPIPPNLQSMVYCGAVRFGGPTEWNRLYTMYTSAEHPLTRSRILTAMGCTQHNHTLNRFLNMALSNPNIDTATAFNAIIDAGDFGVQTFFEFFITKFSTIKKQSYFGDILKKIASKLNTPKHIDVLKNVIIANVEEKEEIISAIEIIQSNVDWNEKYGVIVQNWLTDYVENMNGSATNIKFSCTLLLSIMLMYFIRYY